MDVKRTFIEETRSCFDTQAIKLGPWTMESLMRDPKHLAFVLSRYKFVAKMLEGKKKVLEVGCGDAFGLPIVAQSVGTLYAIDWEEKFIEDNSHRLSFIKNTKFIQHDINIDSLEGIKVNAVYNIDFIEHLENEDIVMKNIIASYEKKEEAIMIIGTPNSTAAQYTSWMNVNLHINLKSYDSLKELLNRYFYNVLMFGMNDEVIHTGYAPMCHYLWGIGIGLR